MKHVFKVEAAWGKGMDNRTVNADYFTVEFGTLLFYKNGTGGAVLILSVAAGLWKTCELEGPDDIH